MFRPTLPFLAAACAAGMTLPADAQVVGGQKLEHHFVEGDSDFHNLGHAITGIGDLDGDFIPDFIVGGNDRDASRGRVTAYSGATGLEIWHVDGENPGDGMGWAVVNLRDIDDDGVHDLGVSAPYNDDLATDGGKAYILSGVDGSTIRSWASSVTDRNRGLALGAADIDNDGYRDLVVGQFVADEIGLTDNGKISVFNAKTGAFFFNSELFGSQDGANFGNAVTGIGDWNGDGYEDVAVGAPSIDSNGLTNNGRVSIFSGAFLADVPGAFGPTLTFIDGPEDRERFGFDISRAGDQDGDGEIDLLVGSPFWTDLAGNANAGRATLWSSATSTMITMYESPDPQANVYFGRAVANAGDVDHDGFRDVLVGAPQYVNTAGDTVGAAFAYSGRTRALLQGSRGNTHDGRFGRAVAGVGDIDGDGTTEYAVGAPFDSTSTFTSNGTVRVIGREAFFTQSTMIAMGGDTVTYDIDFPTAGGQYKILASLIGTGPTTYTGVEVPLDALYIPITSNAYPAWTSGFFGTLSASGEASASMTLPVALPSVTIYLAAIQSNTGATVDLSSVVQILEVL